MWPSANTRLQKVDFQQYCPRVYQFEMDRENSAKGIFEYQRFLSPMLPDVVRYARLHRSDSGIGSEVNSS